MIKNCIHCGQSYKPTRFNQQYCSRPCYHIARLKKPRNPPKTPPTPSKYDLALDQWLLARTRENQIFFNFDILLKIRADKQRHGLSAEEIKRLISFGIIFRTQTHPSARRGTFYEIHLTPYALSVLADIELSKMTEKKALTGLSESAPQGLPVPHRVSGAIYDKGGDQSE